jgi:hypothetical protein
MSGTRIYGTITTDYGDFTGGGEVFSTYSIWAYLTTGGYLYVALEDADGKWVMKRINQSDGTVLYAKGNSAVATAWTDKATLTYATYSEVF